MIFSDFFSDLAALEPVLQQMRYRRHEVVLFQVMHHDELGLRVRPDDQVRRPGDPRRACWPSPRPIRRNYLKAVETFNGRLETICQRNRIERVLVDTSRDMGEVLVDYLNHRSRLNRGR